MGALSRAEDMGALSRTGRSGDSVRSCHWQGLGSRGGEMGALSMAGGRVRSCHWQG